MCYDSGSWQAFLDGELPIQTRSEMAAHLLDCPACRAEQSRLVDCQVFVDKALADYLNAAKLPGGAGAWEQFNQKRLSGLSPKSPKGVSAMLRKYRAAVVAAVVILAVAASMSFVQVRSAAAELLSIFRVNKVQTITITPAEMAKMEQAIRQGGQVDLASLGKIKVDGKVSVTSVSVAEAKQSVDFDFRLPAYLPQGYQLQDVQRRSGETAEFTLDTQKTNEILKTFGGTVMLPAELNGKTFSLNLPVTLTAEYNGFGPLIVAEARSPELAAPNGASVNAIRDALLGIPFLPDSLKGQLASINDWQHTVLVPNFDGSAQDVSVDGTQGVFISPPAGQRRGPVGGALVWQKNGVVYAISGQLPLQEALKIAQSLK